MEKIVQRVRGVMNLLLVWALILFWVATVETVDIDRLCLDLEINWNELLATVQNGGAPPEPSLARRQAPPLHGAALELRNRFISRWNPLAGMRYSSLNSHAKAITHTSANEYIEACQGALEVVQEAKQLNHAAFTSEHALQLIAAIERQIELLRWHVERLELGPAATLNDVAHEARPRIVIPGSGQTIPMAGGVALSLVGLTWVYLYLVSLLRALREALNREDLHQAGDWLFLHPGWLGPLLGMAWLTLPLAALAGAGLTVFSVNGVNGVSKIIPYVAIGLPIAWAWCLIAAIRTRRKMQRLTQPAASSSSTAEARLRAYTDSGISLENYRRAA